MFMESTRQERGRALHVRQLAASKRFGRYKDESVKTSRKPEVQETEGFKRIMESWISYIACPKPSTHEGFPYTPEDVARFCKALGAFQGSVIGPIESYSGFFLTDVINKGQHEDYHLDVSALPFKINNLGQNNVKNLIIVGSTGGALGYEMVSGMIVLKGDICGGGYPMAFGQTGKKMSGGIIEIFGDVTDYTIGEGMSGGKIIINGDVGGEFMFEFGTGLVGEYMAGGEIHINGEHSGIGSVDRGKIFHKGKLIVDK
jgi:hypothetical protein